MYTILLKILKLNFTYLQNIDIFFQIRLQLNIINIEICHIDLLDTIFSSLNLMFSFEHRIIKFSYFFN